MYRIKPTTDAHVRKLVKHISDPDRREVEALYGPDIYAGVRGSVDRTPDPRTVLYDGQVLCIFGIVRASLISGVAFPWCISTYRLRKHYRVFLKGCRRFTNMLEDEKLIAYVDQRHKVALRWMNWMGFEDRGSVKLGVEERPFVEFVKEPEHGS